jgi:4-hydroxy-tetrahydrodipicolinate synthase
MNQKSFKGIIPAAILPFKQNYEIDEQNLRSFIRYLSQIDGVEGILCNGHAGEVVSLSRAERKRVIEIAVSEVGGRLPIISGVHHEHTPDAVRHAQDARDAGAAAVLVVPPGSWLRGKSEAAPYHYFKAIADGVDIPLWIFQYATVSKANYPTKHLLELAGIENVVAVKLSVNDWIRYDHEYRALKSLGKDIRVLTSNNMALLASFTLGADGAVIGSGSLYSELVVQLFSAVENSDLKTAKEIHTRMMPLTELMYSEPQCDVYTRIKTAQVIMGRLENAVVRPPLLPLAESEVDRIEKALRQCGLI